MIYGGTEAQIMPKPNSNLKPKYGVAFLGAKIKHLEEKC